ncbi:MAG: hypothetical protein IH969_00890 [Candidatus Krumholzibacteriota bacterium]|nr:hypothetical protein [Candidatus Krumholzibacteriota bacterium]
MKLKFCRVMAAAAVATVFSTPGMGRIEFDRDGIISLSTRAVADSVTVGQRFHVVHTILYPDTLKMMPLEEIDTGNCRVVTWNQSEEPTEDGRIRGLLELVVMTLDLEAAALPAIAIDFETPGADTLRVFTTEIDVPVRMLTAQSKDLAPLKEQWEAPRSWIFEIGAVIAALALVALAWWLWRRRSRRDVEEEKVPRLPADYVALTELTRIEAMGLPDRGEHKKYYTLVIDVVRLYLGERFTVDTMDRTTSELVSDLRIRNIDVDNLEDLLEHADLVKFARVVPPRAEEDAALQTARGIIRTTTPRVIPSNNGDDESVPATEVHSGGGKEGR